MISHSWQALNKRRQLLGRQRCVVHVSRPAHGAFAWTRRIISLLSMAPAVAALSNCCKTHNTRGCNDAECEAFVCQGDPYCCQQWWNPRCRNAAAATGPMSIRDPSFKRTGFDPTSTARCSVCEGAVLLPPHLPLPPPQPQPPPVPESVGIAAKLCIGFESAQGQAHAVDKPSEFKRAVANAFGVWSHALTNPEASDGCLCGESCSFNGCVIAGYTGNGTQAMLSVAPAVHLNLLWLQDVMHPVVMHPTPREICRDIQDVDKSIEIDVCFSCVGMTHSRTSKLTRYTGLNVTHADLTLDVNFVNYGVADSTFWMIIGSLLLVFSLLIVPCVIVQRCITFARELVRVADWAEAPRHRRNGLPNHGSPKIIGRRRLLQPRFKWDAGDVENSLNRQIADDNEYYNFDKVVMARMWQSLKAKLRALPRARSSRAAVRDESVLSIRVWRLRVLQLLIMIHAPLAFPWAPCWMALWSSGRFVCRDLFTDSIKYSLTQHRLINVSRSRLQWLISTCLVFTPFLAAPMSRNHDSPEVQGNSILGTYSFNSWNLMTGNDCIMLTSDGGTKVFVFDEHEKEIELCLHVLRNTMLATSVQALATAAIAILSAASVLTIGQVDGLHQFRDALPRRMQELLKWGRLQLERSGSSQLKKGEELPPQRMASLRDDPGPEHATTKLVIPDADSEGTHRRKAALWPYLLGAVLGVTSPVVLIVHFAGRLGRQGIDALVSMHAYAYACIQLNMRWHIRIQLPSARSFPCIYIVHSLFSAISHPHSTHLAWWLLDCWHSRAVTCSACFSAAGTRRAGLQSCCTRPRKAAVVTANQGSRSLLRC